jgi:hypothetical protein
LTEFGDLAELVAFAVDEEHRLAAIAQEGEIVAALGDADGRADADERADALVPDARSSPTRAPKEKPARRSGASG